jgi:hypothetical protein
MVYHLTKFHEILTLFTATTIVVNPERATQNRARFRFHAADIGAVMKS